MSVRIVDVTDDASFLLIPPCADPGFDHRSCDYWEDADRGSKAARLAWLEGSPPPAPARPAVPDNPFAPASREPAFNPFAPAGKVSAAAFDPFAGDADADEPVENPFAPRPATRPAVGGDAPRKLGLLGRGLAVFGSYAKVLLVDEVAVAYAQFGPLSAYPRAQRLRDLYRQLPDAPLPAVITCIATTAEARGRGHASALIRAVCDDLAGRGFAAVEAYPEHGTRPDATSAATPAFWVESGFTVVVEDERFPVVRRELS
jgi:GNAT superfamily N-acetyltransferase